MVEAWDGEWRGNEDGVENDQLGRSCVMHITRSKRKQKRILTQKGHFAELACRYSMLDRLVFINQSHNF